MAVDLDLCEACYRIWDAPDGHLKEHPMIVVEVMCPEWYEGQSQDLSKAADYVTGSAGGTSFSWYLSAQSASLEEKIERSKWHWSFLAGQSDETSNNDNEDEVAEESNKRVFQALQLHPSWGGFFCTFGYDLGVYKSMGELKVGKKFAEGGQAELFHAQVTWLDPKGNEWDVANGRQWVVKIFKKGTFLRHLQHQLPHGLLQFWAEERKNWKSSIPKKHARFICEVMWGILLEDGRFAFLMKKEDFDLRSLIDGNMRLGNGNDCGPFSKEDAEVIMYEVALGVDWVHSRDIIHRDLKASNVLIYDSKIGWSRWKCLVADYECSVGVVGTRFFRAPEILKACKEGNVNKKQDVFTKAADIYNYGMTCYEILTGKLPFEGHVINRDEVIKGERPMVPKYVDYWTRELLYKCWESNPRYRPTIEEILDLFVANSRVAKREESNYITIYGYNFRTRTTNKMLSIRN